MIGVSPAFYVSSCTDKFSFSDLIDSLYRLKDLGFEAMQIEVFHAQQLKEWNEENCKRLKKAVLDTEMKISQFVAHFLLNSFVSPEILSSGAGLEDIDTISSFLHRYEFTDLLTIPAGKFQGNFSEKDYENFILKLKMMQDNLRARGIRMAVEPLPGSLAEDLRFLEAIPSIGLNLDPGHLLCSGHNPFKWSEDQMKKVYATHLCENNGIENLSLAPGCIHSKEEWTSMLQTLKQSGFEGSMDLEIICPADEVEEQYQTAQNFINNFEYNIIHSKQGHICSDRCTGEYNEY